MKGYEAIAKAISQEGVEVAFYFLGADTAELLIELQDRWGVKLIHARHEQGAVAMADGYTRVTGKPAVCALTRGPGVTNAATALSVARERKSPVIVVTGDVPTGDRHHYHRMDLPAFAQTTVGQSVTITAPATLQNDIQLTFRLARLRGPVIMCAPPHVQNADLGDQWNYQPSEAVIAAPQRPRPDPEMVRQAVAILSQAERPVIIAGRGAFLSDARAAIEELADRVGALLATTILAKGYFAGQEYSFGVGGGMGTALSEELLMESDCVVVVGHALNVMATGYGKLFRNARVIQIESDRERIGDSLAVELGIGADARSAVEAIYSSLDQAGVTQKTGFRTREVRDRIAAGDSSDAFVHSEGAVDPRFLAGELDRILPNERTVVLDGGAIPFLMQAVSATGPSGILWGAEFGVVGLGLPLAIGAAIGRPEKHCALLMGDAAFMLSVQELDTAVRYKIPMTIVVMDDHGFGAEVHYLKARGKPFGIASGQPGLRCGRSSLPGKSHDSYVS